MAEEIFFLAAQNLGSDIFEAGGQSQFAQSFFNNYLAFKLYMLTLAEVIF